MTMPRWQAHLLNHSLFHALPTGADIFFLPGTFGEFLRFVQEESSDPRVEQGGGLFSAVTNEGHEQTFSMFAITNKTVQRAGLFDENIFPPYYEVRCFQVSFRTACICMHNLP